MKWLTRSHVHVDRVACPWLITRFVDSEAEFLFVPAGSMSIPGQFCHPFRRIPATCSGE